jgi:hypothetical protein
VRYTSVAAAVGAPPMSVDQGQVNEVPEQSSPA